MAKVGLDAICAKLSRNAEITSRELNSCSPAPPHPDKDGYSGCDDAVPETTAGMDRVDEQCRAVASGSASVRASVHSRDRELVIMMTGNEPITSRPVHRTSLMDSGFGDDAAFDDMDDSWTGAAGRRSRRKNFLPRCVQEGQVVVERPSESRLTAASSTTTTWSAAVEDGGQAALDLRTGRSSSTVTRQAGDSAAKFGDGIQDQILDLSVSRCGRDALGDSVQCGSSESGLNEAADMRVYAANTMSELLHIYGLPDDQQSTVTDLRKWVPPENNVGSGTQAPAGGTDVQPMQCEAAGRIQGQVTTTPLSTSHLPDSVMGQMQEHATGIPHVKGS